ncbi:hypothetical protein ZEAMMB73_Zm00001d032847 [Zea mays]|uniref:Uncharacterized protein n=1 Tax=Zea mays TaxID=4577 RepID=A0A1D6KUE2_MAIZE|nr:hypothetical protein ZEAMMB73_Zm00001d032843 [Zea mays]ONM06188.1 hypothetical protein ZEAMMB73_Zm00001d032843 [Zea mays]ONM06192.1 hypothetical protein ZEAMMB73_Zm00001d032847 [Zea mays]ONM06193.1 hypothetical protein ZEAMMB73_Zm00001d032847 [Zea mays]
MLCGGTTSMTGYFIQDENLPSVYLTFFLPQGFEDRFQREANLSASAIFPSLVKVPSLLLLVNPLLTSLAITNLSNVSSSPPEYMSENLARYSAWLGGAILAKVVFPENQHITKGEYDETGRLLCTRSAFRDKLP